jgi:hypothetical protein
MVVRGNLCEKMHLLALGVVRLQFQALLVRRNSTIIIFETMKRSAFAAIAFGPLGIQSHASVSVSGGFFKKTLAGVACRAIGKPAQSRRQLT